MLPNPAQRSGFGVFGWLRGGIRHANPRICVTRYDLRELI